MELDFSKPAPQAKTLEEAQQIINALWEHLAKIHASHQALTLKVAELEEKLNTNSNNSSKAPSTDLFKAKKPKKKYHGTGKNNALKQAIFLPYLYAIVVP